MGVEGALGREGVPSLPQSLEPLGPQDCGGKWGGYRFGSNCRLGRILSPAQLQDCIFNPRLDAAFLTQRTVSGSSVVSPSSPLSAPRGVSLGTDRR